AVYLRVRSPAGDADRTGCGEGQLVSRSPSWASWSRFGVLYCKAPRLLKSPLPISSSSIRTMFGVLGLGCATAGYVARLNPARTSSQNIRFTLMFVVILQSIDKSPDLKKIG